MAAKDSSTDDDKNDAGDERPSRNFIEQIIDADLAAGKNDGRVHTRFPPEPNGYLHIGHAKSICLNFGLADEFNGKFNLRFDDTNPTKEDQEYVDSIIDDVRWLGADWDDRLFYASDYFQQLYDWAVQLIEDGKAYVCDLNAEQVREYRGTLNAPGKNSPFRDRSVKENLDLFSEDAEWRVSGRRADAAGEDRHGVAQHQPARPRDVPHQARRASSLGRQMVHLSVLRLHARPERFDRGDHPFDLYARIRKPPAALRLVLRSAGHPPSAADRIRATQSHLHGDEQAKAVAAGAREARLGLG